MQGQEKEVARFEKRGGEARLEKRVFQGVKKRVRLKKETQGYKKRCHILIRVLYVCIVFAPWKGKLRAVWLLRAHGAGSPH